MLVITSRSPTESPPSYPGFCTDNGRERDLWQAVCETARQCQAMTDLFDKDCTIRAIAVEGMGEHRRFPRNRPSGPVSFEK